MGRPTTTSGYHWNGNTYCSECVAYPVAETLGVGEWAVENGILDLPTREALRNIARRAGALQKDVIRPLGPPSETDFCSDCLQFFARIEGDE